MNILICEDDKHIRDLIEEIVVVDMGHNLFKCSNEAKLFEILEKANIDLIILDYWLDKVKADPIVKKVKGKFPDIPIILMSAIKELADRSEELKVSDYIKKPFEVDKLIYKINQNLPHDN